MPYEKFIHLRTHSAYSLSEGAIKDPELIGLTVKNNMPAIGLTDRGNLFGAMEFSETAMDKGVQPLLGIELALRTDKSQIASESVPPDWIVLFAQNEIGWRNLMTLSSKAYLETPANEIPQVELEILSKFSYPDVIP